MTGSDDSRGWHVAGELVLPHPFSFPIAQITAHPLIAALSVNAVDCFHGQWHVTVFQSFNVFSATKKYSYFDGFGGLVVSVLASGTRVRWFKPGQSRWIFRASEKSSASLPSEGK